MRYLIAVVAVLAVTGCQMPQTRHGDSADFSRVEDAVYSPDTFASQLSMVKNRSRDADFEKIRLSYTATESYTPYKVSPVPEIMSYMRNADYDACIKEANDFLVTDYVSLVTHFALRVCYSESGKQEKSAYHDYVVGGLIDSICASGDGKSSGSAFVVISTEELYGFLNLVGLQVTAQSLGSDENGAFDKMTVRESGKDEEFDLYFDINHQMSRGLNQRM